MAGEHQKSQAASGRGKGKRKKRTRPKRGASHTLGVMIFIVSCIAALAIVYFALLVDKVEVQGATSVSVESILKASEIKPGQHMFLLDEKAARSAVLSNPYIESFEVVRDFPHTVILRVKERVPRAIIADSSGDSVLIDEKGAVLSIGAPEDDSLVLVYGMGNAGYTLAQNIDTGTDFQAEALVNILATVEQAGLTADVKSINMANTLSIELTMREGFLVRLGAPDELADKLTNLSLVLKELRATGKSGGIIYLAARGGPVYSPVESDTPSDTEPADPNASPDPNATDDPGVSPSPGGSPEVSPTLEDDPFSG
ncbi:MAG TPA: FtsQ-type POTRA domain-containing protein [Clostridia bacterium]|nr:FtsQ-type POTRA domain-containing protein [Clostridia bacterium]